MHIEVIREKADMKNKDIEKLLKSHAGDVVIVNGKWKCKFSGNTCSKWIQSMNSPSQYSAIYVDVVEDDNTMLDGCITILKDDTLADKLYGFLYLKKPMSEKWEKMVNIVMYD